MYNDRKRRKLNLFLLIAVIIALLLQPVLSSVVRAECDALFPEDEYLRAGLDGSDEITTEDYRKWAQADPRWGSLRLGSNGRTVAEAGCLVTAVTKVIIQSGYRDAATFNVATLVNWLNANGGLSSDGNLYWYKPSEMIEGFEFEGMDYSAGSSSSSSLQNKIMEHVRSNRHIILTVNNYGHYVAVDNEKSLQMGSVYIMDSLNNTAGNADIPLTSRYSYVNRLCIYSGNNAEDSDYISLCDFEMTHLLAQVASSSAYYYSLPCTVNAGVGSVVIGRAAKDSVIVVTADIVNTRNEHWQQIVTEDGEHVYIWSPQLNFLRFVDDLVIESDEPPCGNLEHGHWFNLSENVVSRHIITRVLGRITDVDGNVLSSSEVTPNVHGGFDISETAVDNGLRFGGLDVGHYCYELLAYASAASGMTSETAQYECIFTSPFSIGTEPLPTYLVTFVDSETNEVLETERIAQGFYPVFPTPPQHEDLEFTGWSSTARIYADTVISTVYGGSFIPGDADGNGVVNFTDALKILRYAMNGGEPEIDLRAADVNGNGIVDSTDALLVMRIALG